VEAATSPSPIPLGEDAEHEFSVLKKMLFLPHSLKIKT